MPDQSLATVPLNGLTEHERLLVVLLADKSGSMDDPSEVEGMSRRDVMMEAHNNFVQDLKAHPLASQIRFVRSLFSNELDPVIRVNLIPEVTLLTKETYVPDGGTALRDAIGSTIKGIDSILKLKPHYRVYFMILSDGKENDSRRYDTIMIHNMISARRLDGWKIEFFGMSEDTIEEAQSLGIPAGCTQRWDANPASTHATFNRSTIMIDAMLTGKNPTSKP